MVISRMFESYVTDIESLLRDGLPRPALRLSVALPDICVALEDQQMSSSAARYAQWCAAWLECAALERRKPLSGERIHRLYALRGRGKGAAESAASITASSLQKLRMRRRSRRGRSLARSRIWEPVGRLQSFQVNLSEALVDAARRWYAKRGAADLVVQRNLGRLLVSA
jgi:hypothetical protein